MVASGREGLRWIILDNRTMVLRDSGEEPDYVPLFEFDQHGVRRFVSPSSSCCYLALQRRRGGCRTGSLIAAAVANLPVLLQRKD